MEEKEKRIETIKKSDILKKREKPANSGRAKGTPNKTTLAMRTIITKVLDDYYQSDRFAKDLAFLDPKDRVMAMEKLTSYAMPKLQSTTLDVISEKKKTIEDTLSKLAEE